MRGSEQNGWRRLRIVASLVLFLTRASVPASADPTHDLLARTQVQVSKFLDQFSDVKCTEQVTQVKLKADGKSSLREESTYDYLVILTTSGGELNLNESRLPVREASSKKAKNLPLLVSNGFATLFLVFHPYYAPSFEFTDLGEEDSGGNRLRKIGFRHIHDTRTPLALALRGREFPLDPIGTAWIEPQTGVVTKMSVHVDGLDDIGLKTMQAELDFAPVSFGDKKDTFWFPHEVSVEVETPRQHWRNVHLFTDYKQFSVNTEEKVAQQ